MLGFSRSSFMVVFVVMFGSPYSAANAESDAHASIPIAHTIVLIHFILGHPPFCSGVSCRAFLCYDLLYHKPSACQRNFCAVRRLYRTANSAILEPDIFES